MNINTDIVVSDTDSLIADGQCTLIYIIDPPHIVSKSVPLLLSLRKAYPTAKIIAYVPKGKLEGVSERVLELHHSLGAELQELSRDLAFNRKRYDKPYKHCLLYTSPSPRDKRQSRMPSSA